MIFKDIYDIVGKTVLEKPLLNKETSINISDLPNGIYVAEVRTDKGIEVRKFIKE